MGIGEPIDLPITQTRNIKNQMKLKSNAEELDRSFPLIDCSKEHLRAWSKKDFGVVEWCGVKERSCMARASAMHGEGTQSREMVLWAISDSDWSEKIQASPAELVFQETSVL